MWLLQSWTFSVEEQVLVYEEYSDFAPPKVVFVVRVKPVAVPHGFLEVLRCS